MGKEILRLLINFVGLILAAEIKLLIIMAVFVGSVWAIIIPLNWIMK